FIEIGIEFIADGPFTDAVYVDTVGWPVANASEGGVDGSVSSDGMTSGGAATGGSSATGGASNSNGRDGRSGGREGRIERGCRRRVVSQRTRKGMAEWLALLLVFTLPLLCRTRRNPRRHAA